MAFFPLDCVLRRLTAAAYEKYASPQTFVRPCPAEKILISEEDIRWCDQTIVDRNNQMSDVNFHMRTVQQGTHSGSAHSSGTRKSGAEDENNRQAREACAEFEALFINMMLKELRATVNKSGLMDGGKAEELYTGLMDTQISRDLATHGGIGLAAMLYRQMADESDARQTKPDEKPAAGVSAKGQKRIPEN
jgi:flagellar protein FlgJ